MKPNFELSLLVLFGLLLVHTIAQLRLGQHISHIDFQKLSKFNIEPGITVSGLSAGASFAMMMHFIFPSFVKGSGLFAGTPMPWSLVVLENPINAFHFPAYREYIDKLARSDLIEDPSLLHDSLGAYVFHGIYDPWPKAISRLSVKIYEWYNVPRIKNKIGNVRAGHCIPTYLRRDRLRNCLFGIQAVCGCGYSAVTEMFAHFYPKNFTQPELTTGPKGHLFRFDQSDFFPNGDTYSWSFESFGYAYVPTQCEPETGKVCRLHFYFMGCAQSYVPLYLGIIPDLVSEAGFLQNADANDLIVLFPQVRPNQGNFSLGCFDMLSFTSPFQNTFSTKFGVHPQAIKKMYQRILTGE